MYLKICWRFLENIFLSKSDTTKPACMPEEGDAEERPLLCHCLPPSGFSCGRMRLSKWEQYSKVGNTNVSWSPFLYPFIPSPLLVSTWLLVSQFIATEGLKVRLFKTAQKIYWVPAPHPFSDKLAWSPRFHPFYLARIRVIQIIFVHKFLIYKIAVIKIYLLLLLKGLY